LPSSPNQFVIGYGMDYAERYCGVDDIRIFPSEVAAPLGDTQQNQQ
jgi:hypoxanthine-guanine phosphoribosyltransferase